MAGVGVARGEGLARTRPEQLGEPQARNRAQGRRSRPIATSADATARVGDPPEVHRDQGRARRLLAVRARRQRRWAVGCVRTRVGGPGGRTLVA